MNEQHLIEMANQIGEFFASMPDRHEALAGIADHVHRFWEPRMRRAILAALDKGSEGGLCQIVRESLSDHRDDLMPART